ncbi:MAG: cytochrome c3 family protein [Desulfocapsaceae bacterium]|nr:cytochrome c3 family protein [Desulfocapsaceae bacterium]
MKTGIIFRAMIISGSILLSAVSSGAADDKGAESIVLNGGSLGSITFPHAVHQGIFVDCKPCHDLFPKEAKVIDKMKAEGKLQKKNVMNMCIKCHKDLTGKGQTAGPTVCMGCHKK